MEWAPPTPALRALKWDFIFNFVIHVILDTFLFLFHMSYVFLALCSSTFKLLSMLNIHIILFLCYISAYYYVPLSIFLYLRKTFFSLLLGWFFCSWPSYIWCGRHWRHLRSSCCHCLHRLRVIGDGLRFPHFFPSCALLALASFLLPAVLLSRALCAWSPWGGR